jgi:tetratricopeptide (TPR) repeat protein
LPILLSACTVSSQQSYVPVIEDRLVKVYPGSSDQPESIEAPSVIISLLDKAMVFHQQGKLQKSAALVERALRIKPEDPLAWNRLAFIRFEQKRWSQAEQLAMKSNALAKGMASLQLRNQRIIEASREKK